MKKRIIGDLKVSKELTTTNNLEMLNTLRNTVAPGLTDPEFLLFAEMCRATGLNPATKEIWAIKAGGRLQLMTGINGFLRIANSHPQFDGMEVELEWEEKGLVAATAKVYRKDRRFPSIATAYMAEYGKQTPIWKTMPSIMLSKCAKSLAIREAFINELGGLYTAEEMPSEFSQPKTYEPPPIDPAIHGDVIEVRPPDAPRPKAVVTFYDTSSLDGDQRLAAERYLRNCEAKLVTETIWRSPIRLNRLSQCITQDVKDEPPVE
jgi:phage recombination protein Bet